MAEHSIGPEIPDPVYDDPKELYAFFGLAAYCAGLLESSLTNLLAAVRFRAADVIPAIHGDGIFEELDTLTFGRLLAEAQRVVPIEAETLRVLKEAKERRNYLIHRFFTRHSEAALRVTGRREMIDELHEIATLFKHADSLADPLWRTAWEQLGVTREHLEATLNMVRREAAARDDV